jgi:hypothetical protein
MVEAVMFAAIGFFAASLLALGVVPLLHARTERLTLQRLESTMPLSLSEVQAERDGLRAEFAMATRRFELKIEALTDKCARQMAELGRRANLINRLQSANGARAVEIVVRRNLTELATTRPAPSQRRRPFLKRLLPRKTAA